LTQKNLETAVKKITNRSGQVRSGQTPRDRTRSEDIRKRCKVDTINDWVRGREKNGIII
jgi:hypothetical protein